MTRYLRILIFAVLAGVVMLPGYPFGAVTSPPDVYIESLDFENAEVRQVFKTLSEIGGVNIIVDRNITETCSIYLADLSWGEAFLAVLKMNDLVAYHDGDFIKVMKVEDYNTQLELVREKELLERLQRPASVQVIKILNARAEDIKTTLDPLLADEDKPSVDLRTNSLVFTVSDSSLAVISEIIHDLDTETRQVSIEVRMVTVDSGATTELGVNWSAIQGGNSATQASTALDGKLLIAEYSGSSGETDLMATLATLIEQNKAEVVSRPHVTTQDNESAVIRSGQQVPVVTYDEARNTVIDLIDANTELIVTPHILSSDRILLDVEATRRSAEGTGIGIRINDESAQVRMITTNGETAVIGGLRQMQNSTQESGIPILQDIPLLGQVFKYTNKQAKQSDLIIFITPRIVDTAGPQLSQTSGMEE